VSDITLPRAVVEQVREALLSFDNWWDDEADTALAALDAALAEPDAKPEPATGEQMTREDIIRWAREAEDYVDTIYAKGEYHPGWLEVFNVRFAALVAEAEREACARVCRTEAEGHNMAFGHHCAEAIRARGTK
jgi:hypothetical protein